LVELRGPLVELRGLLVMLLVMLLVVLRVGLRPFPSRRVVGRPWGPVVPAVWLVRRPRVGPNRRAVRGRAELEDQFVTNGDGQEPVVRLCRLVEHAHKGSDHHHNHPLRIHRPSPFLKKGRLPAEKDNHSYYLHCSIYLKLCQGFGGVLRLGVDNIKKL